MMNIFLCMLIFFSKYGYYQSHICFSGEQRYTVVLCVGCHWIKCGEGTENIDFQYFFIALFIYFVHNYLKRLFKLIVISRCYRGSC